MTALSAHREVQGEDAHDAEQILRSDAREAVVLCGLARQKIRPASGGLFATVLNRRHPINETGEQLMDGA
jgi:hypothetical protein